ncbi:major facilitator superfamily domain-containing protein [Macrophomina phaseolina]|uniref:Major facilitator superfamily domain-containing protein n=1 Tax=Macrophomina phaseolina TaxID=35725 RepID=A0ABQ8G8E9_9PEZI|nr:major facilitator superfamily domain-containing protein [Macrophomina phaseolina]
MHRSYGTTETDDVQGPSATQVLPGIAPGLYFVLPVAFLCSMGMAATSATTIFAYETLLCEDPSNCSQQETERYSATVAFSVAISNFCAVLVLWLLPLLPQGNPKTTLYFWIFTRASSVFVLAIGGYVWIAVSGRVFEGCATDNILQLVLNTLYLRAPSQTQVSRLFGLSLALYMVGQGLSPIISGLFTDFRTSFAIAILIFGLCFLYVWFLPSTCIPEKQHGEAVQAEADDAEGALRPKASSTLAESLLRPLRAVALNPSLWAPEAALLLLLGAMSYIYPALLVFCAVRYGFTGKQNGWIVSLTAASSSLYLLAVHVVWPRLRPAARADPDGRKSRVQVAFDSNFWNAVASMLLLGAVCPLIGQTTQAWQLFPLVALAAMGLSAPSFIKSYAVGLIEDGTRALTALALMETCGALLSPIILGAAQTGRSDSAVFWVASALIAAALSLLTLGAVHHAFPVWPRRTPWWRN